MAEKYESLRIAADMDKFDRDQRIVGKFTFTATTAAELDDSLWPNRLRDVLIAIRDLIGLARNGQVKPVELRRMKIYRVVMDDLYSFVDDIAMIRLGKDANFTFALQRGFEELLKREIEAINGSDGMRAKVRFIKAKTPESGEYQLFDAIAFRFDGQYEIRVIDRHQYATY